MLKSQRQQAHAKAALWFVQAAGARAKDFVGAAAEHFAQAGDTANACESFTRAAEQAAAGFAHDVALGYTERALALAGPTEHAKRWRLLANRERTLDLLGRRGAQRADIDALVALADALDDDRLRAEAAWRRCDIAMRTSDHATQQTEARRAQALAERAGVPELALMAQQRVASALAFCGDPAAGWALALPGLARAQALGLARVRVQLFFLNTLGTCARQLGDLAATLDFDLQSLAMSRQIGDRRLEALFTGNVGAGYLNFGAHALASPHLEEALRLNRAQGHREFEGHNLGVLSVLALQQGDDALALARAQASLDISVEVASRRNECNALADLGNAELALGRWPAATAAFERMQTQARTIKDAAYGLDALESLGRLALARGRCGASLAGHRGPAACGAGRRCGQRPGGRRRQALRRHRRAPHPPDDPPGLGPQRRPPGRVGAG